MFYEDVVGGAVFRTESHVVSSREIAEFASRFDPQPDRAPRGGGL